METLLKALFDYSKTDMYPMHMPGHKRRLIPEQLRSVCKMDITEIEGFDNLHDAKGIIRQAEEYTAELYGSEETAFVINGGSAGILSAIAALCPAGSRILVARNCHKAVYHAIEILQLRPVYLYPHVNRRFGIFEGVSSRETEEILESCKDVKAVVITSPTYDGVVSDIEGICRTVHVKGIPLIVDEAHGAHFHFSEYFPKSALDCGADIVIQSTHKTLPALTQTSILHINGPIVDRRRVRSMLTVFQSSSPSYLLMGSIDGCMHMLSERGEDLYRAYTQMLDDLRESLREMKNLHLFEKEDLEYSSSIDYDRSKLLISTVSTELTGHGLYRKLLEDYHIQMEMEAAQYVLGITSVGDDREGFLRIKEALLDLDRKAEAMGRQAKEMPSEAVGGQAKEMPSETVGGQAKGMPSQFPVLRQRMSIYEAGWGQSRQVMLDEAIGEVSAAYIYLYPPGIPLIAPGEERNEDAAALSRGWRECGMEVTGLKTDGKIFIYRSFE